jgi:hypothetical protein
MLRAHWIPHATYLPAVIWKNRPYQVSRYGDALIIHGGINTIRPIDYGITPQTVLLQPVGVDAHQTAQTIVSILGEHSRPGRRIVFEGVSGATAEILAASTVQVRELPELAEYLYKGQEQIELKGPEFSSKRNKRNRFWRENKNHGAEYLSLNHSPALIERVRAFSRQWIAGRVFDNEGDTAAVLGDGKGAEVLLDNFDHFNLLGGVILIRGEVAAYTLGQYLPTRTLIVYTEKGDRKITGIYQALNNRFLTDLDDGGVPFDTVNRQEGGGLEGLEDRMRSYRPTDRNRVYLVQGQGDE